MRIWVGRASGQHNAPGGQVHIDKDIEALEEDCVDAEEVGQHQGLGVSRQELLPAQLGSATRGWNAGPQQHGPNRGRSHRVPELAQLALNSKVAPAWVLFRHAHDQLPAFS